MTKSITRIIAGLNDGADRVNIAAAQISRGSPRFAE